MSYAYEGGMPTAQRRRRRAAYLTLLGLVVLALAIGGWWALAGGDGDTQPSPGTPTADACPEPPAGITVDVLNATSRAGLASLTADTLRAQRFTVGQAINAPAGTVVEAPAEIRYGPAGAPGAKVLAQYIRGSVLVPVTRQDSRVDLVIGNDFDAVTAPTTTPTC